MFRNHDNANLKSNEANGSTIRLAFIDVLNALRVADKPLVTAPVLMPLLFAATARRAGLLLWFASVIAFLGGCQTLSLPAIDPTGNRIFAPNGFTTLINPHDPNNGYPSTQPAFQAPPNPPACTQTGDKKLCKGCLSGKGCFAKRKEAEEVRGRCGQLLLTPTSIIAPVGGEVILLAGVCGKDGYLVTDEPIEFMISQDGVGEIVQVGDDSKGQRPSFFKKDLRPKVEKLGIDFAKGRTSREPWTITRGTSTPDDDLPVRKGQTWISLTSPNEGTSKVTVLAPDSDVWDQRRQTATIYWEDASWQFPKCVTTESGKDAWLITTVTRADRVTPAEGYKVIYRILNPEIAKFVMPGRVGAQVEEINVDDKGLAAVRLLHDERVPLGTAMVEMEVVRIARPKDNMRQVTLGRDTTTVTWSAPELRLDVGGPEIGVPGQPVNYVATLANTGDRVAENVYLSVVIPPGMDLLSTNVQPSSITPNGRRWDIGPLMPRSAFDINLVLQSQLENQVDVLFEANGANRTEPLRQPVSTRFLRPKVDVQIRPMQNTNQVEIGNEAKFEVIVTNNGTQTLNNIRVLLQSTPGLWHSRTNKNSVEDMIPFLRVGQPEILPANFRVDGEGQLSVKVKVSAEGQEQELATQSAVIIGVPAVPKRPSLSLILESDAGQNAVAVGTEFSARWAVNNTGPVLLRTPVVQMQHSPNLQVLQANGGWQLSEGVEYIEASQLARWTRLGDIAPNGRLAYLSARFRVIAAGPAKIDVAVDSDGVGDRKNITLEVRNNGTGGDILPSGISNGPPGGPQPNGIMNRPELALKSPSEKRLSVTIQPVTNSIRKGDVGTYEITIANLVNKPDQRVVLSILTPKGAVLKSIRAKDLQYKISNADRQIDLEPIKYFRANDSFSCVIQLRHDEVAAGELVASVTSLGQTNAISESHRVQVLP